MPKSTDCRNRQIDEIGKLPKRQTSEIDRIIKTDQIEGKIDDIDRLEGILIKMDRVEDIIDKIAKINFYLNQ